MNKPKGKVPAAKPEELFGRIVSILDQARGSVVRAVNTNMVLAYWLIGREIVHDLQAGEERAGYGEKVVEELSARLTERYGKGFSTTNLKYFRIFFLAYPDRIGPIGHPAGDESVKPTTILSPTGRESTSIPIPYPTGTKSQGVSIPHPPGAELPIPQKSHPPGDELPQGFSPNLS
ncbi:MAG: DUF1016 N-terminal domain-containing protein, partial [bacterium]